MPEKKLSLNLEKNKNVIEIDFMILKMVSWKSQIDPNAIRMNPSRPVHLRNL